MFLALSLSLACAASLEAQRSGARPAPGTVTGFVRNDDRQPMAGAEVAIRPGGKRVRTDSAGRYELTGLEHRSYVAIARKNGFRPQMWEIALPRDAGTTADFELKTSSFEPVEPDSNRKCGRLSLQGFECRQTVAGSSATFLDFPDLDVESRRTTAELFRDLPGFIVRMRSGGGQSVEPATGATCLFYVVDGRAVTQANPVPPASRDVYAMEIYNRASDVPTTDLRELQRANNLGAAGNCRVVLIWTHWMRE